MSAKTVGLHSEARGKSDGGSMPTKSNAPLDLMDLMPDTTPDYMAPAWLSCLLWAVGEPKIRDAFTEETGLRFSPARSEIDAMIYLATGYQEDYVRKFTEWFNVNVWGDVNETPPQETPLAGRDPNGAGDGTKA